MLVERHRTLVLTSVRLTAIAAALLMLTVLTVTRSQAAFSDTTDNTGNSFSTGSVVLTDNDSDVALFDAVAVTPGTPVVGCIQVTYSGTLTPADVKLYATSAGDLDDYLDLTVDVGTGTAADCSDFGLGSNIYTGGTLVDFSTAYNDYSDGLAGFTANANPTSTTFRFTVDVQNDPAAQAKTATAAFTWEAQD